MRQIVLGLGVSFDQYIARKDGAVDWLSMDWEYDWAGFFQTIDTVLMGRKSWEKALEMSGKKSSNPYKGMETYVFSNTLTEISVEDVRVVTGNLSSFVAGLKARKGKDIWLAGGGGLAKSFLDEDLVDKIRLGISPVVLGSGVPLFPELVREIPLRFVSCDICRHKTEDNAMIELLYEVKRD